VEVSGERLLEWAGAADWGREYRRSIYSSLHLFFGHQVLTGKIGDDPSRFLSMIPHGPDEPRPCPEDVYGEAIAGAEPRVKLILWLAAVCGLRRGEIARIHRRDLSEDLGGWSVLVHGKGGKQRTVPMPGWLATEVHKACDSGWMLPGHRDGHLAPARVGNLASAALLGREWTLHTLRHRMATVGYAAERDLIALSKILGHASVRTTQRYVRPPADSLRAIVDAAAA
jgi:integrase